MDGKIMGKREMRDLIETPQTVNHWGEEHVITPLFVAEILGDGKKLIAFVPLATRPNYYVIRIDSSWDLDSDEFYDQIDNICEAISGEYDEKVCGDSRCIDDCNKCDRDWPVLDYNCGSAWAEIPWPSDKEGAAE